MTDSNKENMIEFITGQKFVICSFTNQKHINRVKKLYEYNKDDFAYFHQNDDGSVCCKLPLKYIKISPPKKVSDEQRQAAGERLRKLHTKM